MNTTKLSTVKRIAVATAMLAGCAAVAPAFAGHVSVNVGIGLPVAGVGYYEPAPVYYAPAPVVYAPAPVYYAPAPVYYGPAVGATVIVGGHHGYYHRGGGYYYRDGYRRYGH